MKQHEWLAYFGHKEPTPAQRLACIEIRSAIGRVVEAYCARTPAGHEQTANLRKLKETQQAMIGHLVAELPAEAYH